jgi:urate oxidase
MPEAALSDTSYGKSRIRLVRVTRHGDRHEVRDCTVAVTFEGSYDRSYTDGDNTDVLPTDTMKNTVYALAAQHATKEPETFGALLARHFLERNT